MIHLVSLLPPKPVAVIPGLRLDRYELLCPVAEGGMASVWLARQHGKRGFEKVVAVKMILPKFAQDPRFERMFLDEASIASRICHPNVAQILDLGDEHGILYLAMEWVDGDSLSKLRRAAERQQTRVPLGVALRILADACAGLHCAHELRGASEQPLGVVHRDVSQQNILVSTQGIPKIIDFGIAKARDRVSEETTAGMLKGKLYCMAPEQARGEAVDRRADIFAVGAILHHLITGTPPYQGDNDFATLSRLISGRPPLPLPPEVPAGVRAVVKKALAHDRNARYATAAELRSAIEAAMVDAKIPTSTVDVAAYCGGELAGRAEKRKETIAFALAAALDRANVALRFGADVSAESASGIDGNMLRARQDNAALQADVDIDVSVDAEDLPTSIPSQAAATLGSAAIELPSQPVGRKRGRLVATAGVAALVGTLATVLAVASRSGRPDASASVRTGGSPRPEPAAASPGPVAAETSTPVLSASGVLAGAPSETTSAQAASATPRVVGRPTSLPSRAVRPSGPSRGPSKPAEPDLSSYR
jgi:serine/threonine-protein kinase